MVDIANSFVKRNINTTLVYGRLIERNEKLSPVVKTVKILKYKRSSTVSKLFSWGIASLQIFWLCLFRYRSHEIYFYSNPPIASFITLFIKLKYNIVVFDVYPDVLVHSRIFSHKSFLVKFWQKINLKIYANANRVITISNTMADNLANYIKRVKIEVIPIWGGNAKINQSTNSKNLFLDKYSLSGKFIVMYAGNLGSTHDLLVIPKLTHLIDDKDIIFVIIGNGPQKERLIKYQIDNKIENILFFPYQPQEMLPHMFAAANMAIIPFSSSLSSMSIPSKTFDYLSYGLPLLVIGDENTEIGKLVEKYKNGRVFPDHSLQVAANYISSLTRDVLELNQQKENSYKASSDFSKELAFNYL